LVHSDDESSSESEDEEDADEAETASTDGLQTPSGLETPSGMHSVVSTVPGGLETPDFLELRKGRAPSEVSDGSGPRSLYQVVPEKQTSVRGLMGSERGYDIAGLSNPGANVPVLGDERGMKVREPVAYIGTWFRCLICFASLSAKLTVWMLPLTHLSSKDLRKSNFARSMMQHPAVMLVFLAPATGRIIQT
jgi:hypothetical protein